MYGVRSRTQYVLLGSSINEMVTPIRETQEEADKDFAELGFALNQT